MGRSLSGLRGVPWLYAEGHTLALRFLFCKQPRSCAPPSFRGLPTAPSYRRHSFNPQKPDTLLVSDAAAAAAAAGPAVGR